MIGERFRELRGLLSYTQEQMASSLGISRPQVTNIEAGRSWPSLDTIIQACEVGNVSADWLLELGERSLVEERLADLIKENDRLNREISLIRQGLRSLALTHHGCSEP